MTEEQFIDVTEEATGQRLDRWLSKKVPGVPFSLIQRLLRKRTIRIDGKRTTKGDTRLVCGQVVRIPPIEPGEDRSHMEPRIRDEDRAMMKSIVLYEDDDIIAINKPAGLASQGGTKTKKHVDGLSAALVGKKAEKPRLVHRLDKDTSGVMLLAKTEKAARELGFYFRGREVRKYYWALVSPCPSMEHGTIRAAIAKAGGPNKERMVVDEDEGKKSTTEFCVIESAHTEAAFVAFWPRTGRTHQIRVHACEVLKTPILGDFKYGFDAESWEGMESEKFLHLHAQRLVLPHPTKKGKILDIRADLPPMAVKSWKSLGFNPNYSGDPFSEIE